MIPCLRSGAHHSHSWARSVTYFITIAGLETTERSLILVKTEMPCRIEDIPTIDVVIISHSHYDHLSHPTVMKIRELHPNVHFFVPLKNKKWFLDCGIHNVTELDWWESRDMRLSSMETRAKVEGNNHTAAEGGYLRERKSGGPQDILATIGCLPCQHTSARGPFDKNHTLWASWSVESGGKKVWFGG